MTAAQVTPAAEAVQRRAADPGASAWVAASAGTGKTKVLTDRVLRLMLGGAPPPRILCLTFTRAAAAEMANRLNSRLSRWATADDDELADDLANLCGAPCTVETAVAARRLLARVLDAPGGMRIQTIHAFCESLLGRFPLEADLAPHFEVMDERSAAELMWAAQERVLDAVRGGRRPDLEGALATVTGYCHEVTFTELMGALMGDRGRLAALIADTGGLAGLDGRIRAELGLADDETAESVIASACADGAFDREALAAAAAALGGGSVAERARGQAIAAWLEAGADRPAGFDDYFNMFFTNKEEPRKQLINKATGEAAPEAVSALAAEQARLATVRDRRNKAVTAEATMALLTIGEAMIKAYEREKRARNRLDYDDLILKARDLLRRPGVAPWVLYKLDGGIDHILVDEAQDTNPEQWQVIQALAEEFFAGEGVREGARTVFAVGDAKQSIYSFQRADPDAFARLRDHFAARVAAAAKHWEEVALDISFRSTAAILTAVDAVFAHPPAQHGVVGEGEILRHRPARTEAGGLVEVWPLVEPEPDEPLPAWRPPLERVGGEPPRARLARLVAAKIARLCGGERLESKGRAIRPGDIMVLVRRRDPLVDELVRALKARDVEVAGVDRLVLTDHIAVMDLIALGRFLLMPEDDLSLAELLKSPLVGFDDGQLLDLAYQRRGSLWRALRARRGDEPAYREAVDLLGTLLAEADRMPPYELYADVLGARGGRRALLARLGPEAADPIDEFLAQALAFQRSHVPSLQGFLQWLESGEVEVRRDLDQGRIDSVRILTVHGAKGLEAPIVILPDTVQPPQKLPPLLWTADGAGLLWPPRKAYADSIAAGRSEWAAQRRDREYRRLLYVAMTRAEDRLYVCGWRGKKAPSEGGWHGLITEALAGIAEEVTDPFFAGEPGAPQGPVLRLTSPQKGEVAAAVCEPEAEVPGALPEWACKPAPAEPTPPRPLTPSAPGGEAPPAARPLAEDGDAVTRGRLIHRLLQFLPDLAPGARAAACRRFLSRPALALDAAAQTEIADATLRILDDPAFAPLFGPASRAEVAVAGLVPGPGGDRVVLGRIDRLAVSDSEVLIVDFKTDRRPPDDPAAIPMVYLDQITAYRAALREIYPDRAVKCALLWTAQPRLMALDEALLDGRHLDRVRSPP